MRKLTKISNNTQDANRYRTHIDSSRAMILQIYTSYGFVRGLISSTDLLYILLFGLASIAKSAYGTWRLKQKEKETEKLLEKLLENLRTTLEGEN
jgi:hypothetical protein